MTFAPEKQQLSTAVGGILLLIALMAASCAPAPGTADATVGQADLAHPGHMVYQEWCAACHEAEDGVGGVGAPNLAALQQLNRGTIEYSLRQGYMRMQAANVPEPELADLIDFLAVAGSTNDAWVEKARCSGARGEVRLDAAPTVAGFGVDPSGQRRLSAEQSGLATNDLRNLELAWAIGFPQTPTMRAQPVVVGSTIFVAATDSGRLFALDTDTGCVKWMYASDLPLRSSLSFARSETLAKSLIVLGDAAGLVHAVDAATGELVWKQDVKRHSTHRLTGAPTVYGDRIFAPLSTIEINYARDDSYECCRSRGAVVALDLATGGEVWVGYTMEEPTPRGKNRAGAQLWGPSGAPIWSTPLVDPERNVVYAGTGTNFSLPATDTSDALIAFDMNTGEVRWKFQAAENDVWNGACARQGANCDFGDKSIIRDLDWGATPLLGKLSDGRDALFAGHKNGSIWAFDPDNDWSVIWRADFGPGSASGGVHWGMAYDGKRVFAPLNDPVGPGRENLHGPGLKALDVDTGRVVWSHDIVPDCSGDRAARVRNCATRPGLSAAPLLIDGALVTGSTDGVIRIFDAETGEVLFSFDTVRPFATVNGVPGQGGGIDNAPFVAANGRLFVNSGYNRFGHPPGNVLLAFRPKQS